MVRGRQRVRGLHRRSRRVAAGAQPRGGDGGGAGALERGTHLGSSHDLEVQWGEQVLAMVPCGERVRFTSSGTEATMMALRLARAYTGRDRVVTLVEHFHGWHDIVVGALREDDPHPHAAGVPDGFYDSAHGGAVWRRRGAAEGAGRARRGGADPGANGRALRHAPAGAAYLHAAREATAESDTLLVMDEVDHRLPHGPRGRAGALRRHPRPLHARQDPRRRPPRRLRHRPRGGGVDAGDPRSTTRTGTAAARGPPRAPSTPTPSPPPRTSRHCA